MTKSVREDMVKKCSQAWWYTPITPAHKRSRQGDQQFKASLGYIAGPWPKKKEGKEDKGRREGRGEKIKEKGGDREGLLLGAKF